ncbi:MAG TPA: hypothetical protein VFY17_06790 [Pilimelia sp.]|nr:hypothetical protein [Pilimelia sp.]
MAIEVEDDKGFRMRERRYQRIGLALVTVFLAAGLLGLCGVSGPFSHTVAHAGGLTLEYPRFLHHRGDATVRVRLAGAAVRGDSADIELGRSFLAAVDVEALHPQPAQETHSETGVRYQFPATPGAPVVVAVTFRPTRYGPLRATLRTTAGALTFRQFVYP